MSLCAWQFHDLLSQTTSPLNQLDPYTSRSMDTLLPLTETDRRWRGGDPDCSVSLRSYSERPRSVVSPSFHFIFTRLSLNSRCFDTELLPKSYWLTCTLPETKNQNIAIRKHNFQSQILTISHNFIWFSRKLNIIENDNYSCSLLQIIYSFKGLAGWFS